MTIYLQPNEEVTAQRRSHSPTKKSQPNEEVTQLVIRRLPATPTRRITNSNPSHCEAPTQTRKELNTGKAPGLTITTQRIIFLLLNKITALHLATSAPFDQRPHDGRRQKHALALRANCNQTQHQIRPVARGETLCSVSRHTTLSDKSETCQNYSH